MRNTLVYLAILVLLLELYRLRREYWLRRLLEEKKKAKRPRKPAVLRPKRERDGPFCRAEKGRGATAKREMPVAWQRRKGRGGPKKKIPTEGSFCPNQACEYDGITDEQIHALVGYGTHGKQEVIQDIKC